MHFKGWRLHFVLLAALLSLCLLTGGQWAYQHFGQEKPLARALEAVPGVQGVQITSGTSGLEVGVTLGQVADLQQTYKQLEKVIQGIYGQQPVKVVIKDNPSPVLDRLWQASQYSVYEASVRGNFTTMATSIAQLASKAGVPDYAINIDERNIYLQFRQGQNYLYRIIPRQNNSQQGGGV
ncbi:hypothetical protein [Neomoorella thermoacetica]|uniref:hypothetical protein n=1 Tax=Neomoorella thermoacetica TaxID=1525 RepID=UPI0008FB56AD|nr:hypothetical protein [Moorella thermoacetica]APC08216.1 hypothetical protein MTJW_10480 [Moorella thermoacetica]